MPNPVDVNYDVLLCDLELLDTNSGEYKVCHSVIHFSDVFLTEIQSYVQEGATGCPSICWSTGACYRHHDYFVCIEIKYICEAASPNQ